MKRPAVKKPHKKTGPTPINGVFIDIRTASSQFGLARCRLYELAKAGKIPHRWLGNRLLFEPNELKRWYAQLPGVSPEEAAAKMAN
jgi:hypothetical protein